MFRVPKTCPLLWQAQGTRAYHHRSSTNKLCMTLSNAPCTVTLQRLPPPARQQAIQGPGHVPVTGYLHAHVWVYQGAAGSRSSACGAVQPRLRQLQKPMFLRRAVSNSTQPRQPTSSCRAFQEHRTAPSRL